MHRRHMVALLAGTLQPTWSQGAVRLDISFDEGSFPLQFGLSDGMAAGLYPAIVGAVCGRLGWTSQLVARPFKRILADLAAGESCGGALVRTPEREAYALFSEPYYTERLLAYSMRSQVRVFQKFSDLEGRRVGVIRGWSYGPEFDAARQQRRFDVEEVATDKQNFVKLFRERIDYVVAPELSGRLLARSAPAGTSVMESEHPVAQTPIHFAVPRMLPQAAERIVEFNSALKELVRDGGLARLVERELQQPAR